MFKTRIVPCGLRDAAVAHMITDYGAGNQEMIFLKIWYLLSFLVLHIRRFVHDD